MASLVRGQSGRQDTAIWIRDSGRIGLLSSDPYGDHGSSARANMVDTARCDPAQTSWRSDVGKINVWLHTGMLDTMKKLANTYGFTFYAGFIAGGDHSAGSYHYRGTAFDVSTINGRGISYSHPSWRTFNQRCRDNGAVEVLGPGNAGHDTHVHNAWPSGGSASSPGGCSDTVKRPTNLRAKALGQNRIQLNWSDNSGNENGFEIQKNRNSSNGPWNTEKKVNANDNQYTVNDLPPGTKFWFRVRGYNGQDNSEWSNVDNATTIDSPPGAPDTLLAVAITDDKINLTWKDHANNEHGFKIFRSIDGTDFSKIDEIGNNRESYTDTDLRGNRKYWYKVCAWNSWGNSDFSNKSSDTTPPNAPTGLTAARGGTWDSAKLTWTDNAGAEVGFKIERSTSANGPFTQIAINPASDRSYLDVGLPGTTTFYYRVRTYNANGNSAYSNVDQMTTGNAPPVLSPIGNKSVAANQTLAFGATATDPNQSIETTGMYDFQVASVPTADGTVMFRSPGHSATTSTYLTTATNYCKVVNTQPTGNGSTKALKAHWTFKTGQANQWIRLTTANAQTKGNPVIDLSHTVKIKIHSSKAIKVGLGVRETTDNPPIGGDGGTTGPIEWVGVTNVVGGVPMPERLVPANTWTTLSFNCQKNPAYPFTGGDGVVKLGRGVLEHLAIVAAGGSGAYTVYIDDIDVTYNNTLDYTLDVGVPAGASIGKKNGRFSWIPTSTQAGNHQTTVRVTDQLGADDSETITVTVTGTGNNPPVLSAIGNKTVDEGAALTFTATATDVDTVQTRTFSLDTGAPSGASINSTSGAFSWTPTESQGPGTYPVTVRVTDNGSPAATSTETITVTVNEVNNAPVLPVVATQTANEQQLFTFTPGASDSDSPAQTLTYELLVKPIGMTINTNTGTITWTPTEGDGPDTNQVTVRVTDNGIPRLFRERTFNVVVAEVNIAPVLTVATAAYGGSPIADFEEYAAGTYNGTVMFRQPNFSTTTTAHLNATPNIVSVTDTFPEGVPGGKVLNAMFSFKTGTTSPWLRLTTFNTTLGNALPNPTVHFNRKVRFQIWSDKSLKVALGLRETGTSAEIGADGGSTGTLEWIGATAYGSSPNPSRVVDPTNWVTLEFDLPNEVVTAFPFSGNGTLSSSTGKGVLDHLALVPNGGTGTYNVYLDNFQVLSLTTNLVVDTGKSIVLTNSATDADLPTQGLTFTLEPGAPDNAIIDSKTGTFEWTPTPAQSPSTNVIGIRVTDDGVPELSDVKTVTIRVNKINTKPRMVEYLAEYFVTPGETVEYTASATDADLPTDTLTYSLVGTPPSGATINSSSGIFTWTPTTANGTNYAIIRVTDNGAPALYDELTLIIVVSPVNAAPTLSLGTARIVEPIATFESFNDDTPNGTVMFRQPSYSSTTTNFLGTTSNYTRVTTSFPTGNAKAGSKVLAAQWGFKTGATNLWVRLSTENTASIPNPTINASARLKFDVYTTKALRIALGVRETGTTAENGANGGTTGTIEWVGMNSSGAISRLVNVSNWTTLEFDLPNEPINPFTGNGTLNGGQQVLEHLNLQAADGVGAYKVYFDNFEVVTTAALPGTVTMKGNSILSFDASASDPTSDPLTFGLELGAPASATIDSGNGIFSWQPLGYDGTTNEITVYVEDSPAGGTQTKRDAQTFTVLVQADALAPQSGDAAGSFIAGGDTATVTWNSVPGSQYTVQWRDVAGTTWTSIETITATDAVTSIVIVNAAGDRHYRIVALGELVDE